MKSLIIRLVLLATLAPLSRLDAQSNYATPYAFTTLAGTAGSVGSTDGTGSAARFAAPQGVAVDGAGNIYIADGGNQTIRKITAAGEVTTLAGLAGVAGSTDGTGSAARFRNPLGVAVDGSGNVYVSDNQNQTIRMITPDGVVTTLAGSPLSAGSADGTGSAARFYFPGGVAVDSAGNVYVADNVNCTIRKIAPGGVVTTFAGTAGGIGSADGTGSAAQFHNPLGVAIDGAGNVYVLDNQNQTIRKITPGRVVTTLAGTAGGVGSADGTGSAARFNYPYGLAADGAGNVYVTDTGSNTIRKITPGGVVTTLAGSSLGAGSADGTGSAARFAQPSAVAADGSGNVYVADTGNNTIRKGVTTVVTVVARDFNGDGKSDIIWTNTMTGERAMWLMNGGALSGGVSLGTVPTDWKISGVGDFDGDHKADVMLSNTVTGDRAMWLMNGTTITSNLYLGNVPVAWIVSAVGDFNGDGKMDIFWSNTATGDRAVWLMNGGSVIAAGYLGNVPVEWTVSGTGDFDGDGKADIVWTNTATGDRSIWLMNGLTLSGGASLGNVPLAWTISGVGDFNGDGKADILLSNTSSGDRAMWLMNGSVISSNLYVGNMPVAWTSSAIGDFDGDGKADIFWSNTGTGDRAVWLMNGGTLSAGFYLGAIPVEWITAP